MRELSLFSGAGGGLLGTKIIGWRTVGYVEIEDYCQRVIKQRIEDGIFDNAPIFSDIRTFNSEGYAEQYKGVVDVISAGFPCQPHSICGKRRGGKTNEICGRRQSQPYALLDLNTSGWKTLQASLHLGTSEPFLKAFPKAGMWDDTYLWEVRLSVHCVKAKDYGFSLLRPTAQCWKAWTFRNLFCLIKKNHSDGNIQEQSARCFHRMITPESNEILMQWPEGWSDLKPLEMDKIRFWLQQHGGYCQKD